MCVSAHGASAINVLSKQAIQYDNKCACDPRSDCDTARSMLDSTVIYIDIFITAHDAAPVDGKNINNYLMCLGVVCVTQRKSTKGRRTMT